MDPKPKSNAVLKTLPEERQEQIAEWCAKPNDVNEATGRPIPKTGGLAFAREQLAADGLKVSLSALSEFFSWWQRRWRMRAALEASEHQRELMEKFRPEDKQLAREFAEFTLLQKASELQDKDLFTAATMAADMRRTGDLKERELQAKIAGSKVKADQKEREIALAERKFQRDTCKLFLKWFDSEQAKTIATSSASNTEKIEQLGLAMFGEDWKA